MNAFWAMLNNIFSAIGTSARAVNEAAEAAERVCKTANNTAAVYEAKTAKELQEELEGSDLHVDLLDRYKKKQQAAA